MTTAAGTIGESHTAELADVRFLALVMDSNVQSEQWHGVELATALVARKLLLEVPQLVILHVAVIVERPTALVAHVSLYRAIDLGFWSPLSGLSDVLPRRWRWTICLLDHRHTKPLDPDSWGLSVREILVLDPDFFGRRIS